MAGAQWTCLQPKKLAINPYVESAEDEWKFWHKTFTNFIEAMPEGDGALDKLTVLTAYLTSPIYKLISEETNYDDAMAALEKLFVKPENQLYVRHRFMTAHQDDWESIDQFAMRIDEMSQDCRFVPVSAQQYKDEMKRDSFIGGIFSNFIKERLLEYKTLTFNEAYEKAKALQLATPKSKYEFNFEISSSESGVKKDKNSPEPDKDNSDGVSVQGEMLLQPILAGGQISPLS